MVNFEEEETISIIESRDDQEQSEGGNLFQKKKGDLLSNFETGGLCNITPIFCREKTAEQRILLKFYNEIQGHESKEQVATLYSAFYNKINKYKSE